VQEIRPALRHQPAPPAASVGDKLHLDELSVHIQGVQHYLWCAVGIRTAKCFFKRLLKGL
jgi:transposase-like protein